MACSSESGDQLRFYVGTYTNGSSEGIYQGVFDKGSAEFGELKLVYRLENPSFLHLYGGNMLAVSSVKDGQVYTLKGVGGDTLSLLNRMSTKGVNPCYVEYDDSVRLAAVANYGSGDGVVYRVAEDGRFKQEIAYYKHEGRGPDESRQTSAHAHCSVFSPLHRFLYVADLGTDEIRGYLVRNNGIERSFLAMKMEPGDGPRQLAFSADGMRAFVLNELTSTLVMAKVDTATGRFSQLDRISTLPEGFAGHNQCAEIVLSKEGYLYASNRGHNSIAVLTHSDDQLQVIQWEDVKGNWPRHFGISLDGEYLMVANRRSDNLIMFDIDKSTGKLNYTGAQIEVSTPSCVRFY